jgi:hypothetical protein
LNQGEFIMLIFSLAHVDAEKLLAQESWRAHLIAQRAQRLNHVVNANPVRI